VHPRFPNRVAETDEIGYVFMVAYAAADGSQITHYTTGTQISLQQTVYSQFDYWRLQPARRDGHAIPTAAMQSFIFNPRLASASGSDATPRLLKVTPIYLADYDHWHFGLRPVVPVTLEIDETGKATDVRLPPGSQLSLFIIRSAIDEWKFAAARKNGRPIAATITLNAVMMPNLAEFSDNYIPAKVIKSVDFVYPVGMEYSGMSGEVLLLCTVNQLGLPTQISVVESNNPGFEDEAIEDMRQFRFKPATLDGRPIEAAIDMRVNFYSHLQSATTGYVNRGSADHLPEAYRYDVAPRLRGAIQPVYPYSLLLARDHGEASVAFTIGSDGRVKSTRVMNATRPEYGLALVAAVSHFHFDPALRKGKPILTISSIHHNFNKSTRLPGITDGNAGDEMSFANHIVEVPTEVVSAKLLDAPLHAFSRRAGVFPPDLTTVRSGKAVIRVIIDETGHARIPQVTSATDPAFGYAGVQSAQYWRFDPPMLHGKLVKTMVEIPFTFTAGS